MNKRDVVFTFSLYAQQDFVRKSEKKTLMNRIDTGRGSSWHLVDAKNMVAGRLAPRIANFLVGKHKPTYNPRLDEGDYVVVVNASKIKLTGRKSKDKLFYWHTGYPGGIKSTTPSRLQERGQASEILRKAVSGMLPKNKLRKHREKRLILFPDCEMYGLFDDVLERMQKNPIWFHQEFSESELEEFDSPEDGGEWEDVPELSVDDLRTWLDMNPTDRSR